MNTRIRLLQYATSSLLLAILTKGEGAYSCADEDDQHRQLINIPVVVEKFLPNETTGYFKDT